MSSSDMAVETGLVHFVGVIQDTTAHETSPLHFSRQNQTVPSRQIASVYFCVGERANTVRVQHAVPLERTRGDHRNAQLRLVLIAPEPRQQLRHAKVRVLRPPGGTVVRCIKLCDATTRFRWHSSPCKETPHTHCNTRTRRGGVSPPRIHRAPPSRPGRPLACVHSSLKDSCLISESRGAMHRPAPTAHDAVRRKSRPPLRTSSRHTELSASFRSLVPTHFFTCTHTPLPICTAAVTTNMLRLTSVERFKSQKIREWSRECRCMASFFTIATTSHPWRSRCLKSRCGAFRTMNVYVPALRHLSMEKPAQPLPRLQNFRESFCIGLVVRSRLGASALACSVRRHRSGRTLLCHRCGSPPLVAYASGSSKDCSIFGKLCAAFNTARRVSSSSSCALSSKSSST